jgi:hypothetical protein
MSSVGRCEVDAELCIGPPTQRPLKFLTTDITASGALVARRSCSSAPAIPDVGISRAERLYNGALEPTQPSTHAHVVRRLTNPLRSFLPHRETKIRMTAPMRKFRMNDLS